MILSPGTRLGSYEIVGKIGAGGMGEVYRAKDPKLGREVAIKVLPEGFAEDPDRLRRFQQEARTLAALSHPNVVQVHDAGEHGGAPYLVMELLEGETLREKLVGKPIAPKRAVEIAREAALGLSAAHAKGILHRDLKPENIFLTKDGRVKVLDFGLAKTHATVSGSKVETATVSEPGHVVGTSGYMSPEQVSGESLDARSDLFSLGIILWEMLTGKRPFHRDSSLETMHAILKDDLPDLDEALKVPPALERILRTCLSKEPTGRFHSAHDLAFALDNLSSGSHASLPHSARPRKGIRAWLALAVILLLGIGLAVGWAVKRALPPPVFRKLTFGRGAIDAARFVPGSRDIVYSARWLGNPSTVFVLREGSLESRALEAPGAMLMSVSARGEAAVLTQPILQEAMLRGKLSILPLVSGAARPVRDRVTAAEFSPDGSSLAFNAMAGFEWPAGEVLLKKGWVVRNPRIRGTQVTYFDPDEGIRVMDRAGKPRTLVSCKNVTSLSWGPDGREIWYSTFDDGESRIQAVSLTGRTWLLARYPERLELTDVDPDGRCLAIVSSHARQAFGRAPGATQDTELTWLDAQTPRGLTTDGSQVLLANFGDWDMKDLATLYLRPLRGGPALRVGTGSAWAALSSDGRWVATEEIAAGGQRGLRVLSTGVAPSRWYSLGKYQNDDFWFHPSGDSVECVLLFKGVIRLDLASGAIQEVLSHSVYTFPGYNLAPDGQRRVMVDGMATAAERERGVLFPLDLFEGDGSQPKPVKGSLDTEALAGWDEHSREIYLFDRNVIPAPVVKLNPLTGVRTPFLQITPPDPSGIRGISFLFITPSGKAYAYSVLRKLSDLYLIEGLK